MRLPAADHAAVRLSDTAGTTQLHGHRQLLGEDADSNRIAYLLSCRITILVGFVGCSGSLGDAVPA
jgi:hypothetical protein